MIFEDELTEVLGQDSFYLNLYLEEKSDNINVSENITVIEGLLSVNSILEGVKDKRNSVFFISGPPVMIELFQKQLILSGIEKEKIIVDEWG